MNISNRNNTKLKRYLSKIKGDSKLYLLAINYSFQMNNTIKALHEIGMQVDGIVDDYYLEDEYAGYRVIKMEELPKDAFVISMVTATSLWTVLEKLNLLNIQKTLTYWDLCLVAPEKFPLTWINKNNIKDISENKHLYLELFEELADEESKYTLERVVNFRYTFDIDYLKSFYREIKSKQYFDEVIQNIEFDTFVDCGGYDGKTTLDFINYNKNYKTVYYFEPSRINMQKSKQNLDGYDSIQFFEKGTYSKNTKLKFEGEAGTSSAISDLGKDIIEVVKLDDIVDGERIFIKMDVEAAEIETLLGAENLIKEKKPVLAICIYHDQSHFWQVPKVIKQFRDDYKIFLRHYSEGDLETVMYFI